MFSSSLHFLPDSFNRQEYIIGPYFIEEKPQTDIIKFAETLAVDMSTLKYRIFTEMEIERINSYEKFFSRFFLENE